MKKLLTFILMFSLLFSFACADTVHIERQLTEKVSVDANFSFQPVESAPTLVMHVPNLPKNEGITAEELADYFFQGDAPRELYEADDGYMRNILASDGESACTYMFGNILYLSSQYYERYGAVADFMQGNLDYPQYCPREILLTEDDLSGEHAGFPRADANAVAKDALTFVIGADSHLVPELLYQYALSHEQIQWLYDKALEFPETLRGMLEDVPANWDEADDLYFIKYGFSLNGLPLFTKTDGVTFLNDDALPMHPLYAETIVGRQGIVKMDAYWATSTDDPADPPQPLLAPEEALDAVKAYFESIIELDELIITDAFLEYFTATSPASMEHLEFTPVWAFSFDLIYDGRRIENIRTMRFNAITGEFII